MRAKSTLAVVCVLMGTCAILPAAEAARSEGRQAQKPFRTAQATPQQVARPAEPAKPAQRAQHAAPVHAAQQAPRQPSAPRPQAAAPASPQPAAPAVRQAVIPPQQQAQAALATPAVARGFSAGGGTPILPVFVTSGVSCVPFARMATGMAISGDARLWWDNAAGTYARGQMPERGAVLAFPGSGNMSRGHVAVVSRVVNARTIHIDHANWGGPGIRRGTVMRGVVVVDVSDRNDWTAVRVQVGHDSGTFGRTYAAHGFIYNRPAGARIMTAGAGSLVEVAEASSPHAALHMRLAAETLGR